MIDPREARTWLETWRAAGAVLQEERLQALRELTDEEARRVTLQLFAMWRRPLVDPAGAELVEQQRWFAIAARR